MKNYYSTSNSSVYSNSKSRVEMSSAAFRKILDTIGTIQPEQGGVLGMDKSGVITHFFHDQSARKTVTTYSPNTQVVQQVINSWEEEDIRFCGFIHSHPSYPYPSSGDCDYAERILTAMPKMLQGVMHMPIVSVDRVFGTMTINWFVMKKNGKHGLVTEAAELYVDGQRINSPVSTACKAVTSEPLTAPAAAQITETDSEQVSGAAAQTDKPAIFLRNKDLLPLEELRNRKVVVIGCGGARGFCESMARSAVGRFVLVDGDTVSETNIATQGVYLNEVGMFKTEVIAKTLRRINPAVEVVEIRRFLDDSFADHELEAAVGEKLLAEHPEHVLLCGCTDNFPAQDRTVKLSLKWGVPYLAAQVYAEGRAAETVFTYPGVTEACPRCMLSSRYRAYNTGKPERVTSESAPVFVTERMNALKSHIALMLLLYGTDSRLGAELEQVRKRNLVLMSFTADCEAVLGIRAFSRTMQGLDVQNREALQTEGTVWLEQKPDCPKNGFASCPYCAGIGDLRTLRGRQADTRKPYDLTGLLRLIEAEPLSKSESA